METATWPSRRACRGRSRSLTPAGPRGSWYSAARPSLLIPMPVAIVAARIRAAVSEGEQDEAPSISDLSFCGRLGGDRLRLDSGPGRGSGEAGSRDGLRAFPDDQH